MSSLQATESLLFPQKAWIDGKDPWCHSELCMCIATPPRVWRFNAETLDNAWALARLGGLKHGPLFQANPRVNGMVGGWGSQPRPFKRQCAWASCGFGDALLVAESTQQSQNSKTPTTQNSRFPYFVAQAHMCPPVFCLVCHRRLLEKTSSIMRFRCLVSIILLPQRYYE